jgi:hypothetical protein
MQLNPAQRIPASRTWGRIVDLKRSKDWRRLSGSRACRNDRFVQILLQNSKIE